MGGNKARRFSLSSEQIIGPPLSPQSSQASSGSGSETHLDLAGYDSPEMRGIYFNTLVVMYSTYYVRKIDFTKT